MNCKYTAGNTCNKGYSFESQLCFGKVNLVKLDKEFSEANNWIDEPIVEEREKKHAKFKDLIKTTIRMYACFSIDKDIHCDCFIAYEEDKKNPWEYGECVVESEKTKAEKEAYLFILQDAIEKLNLKRKFVQMSINIGQSYKIDYSRIL